MPIFTDELLGGLPKENTLQTYLGSVTPLKISEPSNTVKAPDFGFSTGPKELMTMDRLSKIKVGLPGGFGTPYSAVTNKELDENARYPLYERGIDLENVYGLQQGWMSALGSGVAKGAVRAVGTFAQSFANIPNVIDAIRKEDFSQLSGDVDGYEGTIDNWVENFENYLPNYYTRREKESPWLAALPFMPGSANFWGDKIIKNLGFMAGAIAGAVVQDAIIGAVTGGIGEIPLIAGQIGKASLALNKMFSAINKGDDIIAFAAKAAGGIDDGVKALNAVANAAQYTKLANGFKYATTLIGSAMTESGVESREGYRMVTEALIEEYKLKNLGEYPGQEILAEIDQYATDAMNTRFGINMALLIVSNAVMFGNGFKSLGKAEKIISSNYVRKIADAGKIGLKEGSIDVFEKKVTSGIGNKVWEFAKPKLPTIFSEGVYEEGGQFAAEKGTYDYFTRKYKNLNNPTNKESWNNVDEAINSTMEGLSEQFGSEEGLQNMFIGAISALLMGAGQGAIDKSKGNGRDARLQKSINILNKNLLTGTLQNKYEDTATSIAIAKDMQEAAKSGDLFKYRNLQNSLFFRMVNTRSQAGMHDVTVDQLEMLKDLSDEEFTKQFGIDFTKENQNTVVSYVDALISRANKMDADIKQINEIYTNPFTSVTDATTSEEAIENNNFRAFEIWKNEIAEIKSHVDYMEIRADETAIKVMAKFPSLDNGVLKAMTSKEGLNEFAEEYAQDANLLQDSIVETTPARERRKTREQIKKLHSLASKANLLANRIETDQDIDQSYFEEILSYENNSRDSNSNKRISPEDAIDLRYKGSDLNRGEKIAKDLSDKMVALTSRKGMEKFIEQENDVRNQVVPEEKNGINYVNEKRKSVPLELDREYSVDKTKEVKFKKIGAKRFEIVLPSGEKIYTTTEAQAQNEIDIANKGLKNLSKVKVLSLNENGSVTIEDNNGDVFDIMPERLKGYSRIATAQEKLLKQSEKLNKLQKGIEIKSGTIATVPVTGDLPFFGEGKIKSTEKLFVSTTTESVDFAQQAGRTVAPHITRSFTFLENVEDFPNRENVQAMLVTANQEDSVGLTGLSVLSNPNSTVENDKTNVSTGFMAQVFVVQEGGKLYYISETGKTLNEVGTPADLSQIVFQTMPTTETVWPSTGKPRYRDGEKDSAELESKRYEAFRKEYFAAEDAKSFPFIVSRGIANEGPEDYRGHVSSVFIDENKISTQQGLIQIATTDSVIYQGETLKVPNGVPMILYKDKLEYLKNRVFSHKESVTIYEVIKAFASELLERAESTTTGNISKISDNSTFLQNVLYWKSKLNEGDSVSNNQIYIDLKKMTIALGIKSYNIDSIEAHEKDIIDQLSNIYSSVNNTTLTKEFDKPFAELSFESGGIVSRQWENYQSYLLSSKNPNGSARNIKETPLTTNILAPTDIVPYSFKQKYSTLEDIDFPEVSVKPTAKISVVTPDTKIVAGVILDGVTNNTVPTSQGDVLFTAIINEEGAPEITIGKDATTLSVIIKLSQQPNVMTVVTDTLKTVNYKFDDATPAEDLVVVWLDLNQTTKISLELEKTKEETTVVTPTTVTVKSTVVEEVSTASSSGVKSFGGNRGGLNMRSIGVKDSKDRMTEQDIENFRIWANENVPTIPFEILENIISTKDGEKAWGVFEEGVVKFVKGGLKGTEYHEVFEAIYNAMLSKEEQTALLEEFKAKRGSFLDRKTKKRIAYDEATDLEAKERIADDFADFRLGKLPIKNLSDLFRKFYQAILEFARLFKTSTLKQSLFKSINDGKFKKTTLKPYTTSEYRAVDGLTDQQTYEFVQDMTAMAAGFIFNEKSKASLFNPIQVTGKEVFTQIENWYSSADENNENGFNKRELLGDKAWNELIQRTKESLRVLQINFDENDEANINDEGANKNEYADTPFTLDSKKSSTWAIKFIMATLMETENTGKRGLSIELPSPKLSSVAGYKLLNFGRAFATVLSKLSNTSSIPNAMEKLIELATEDSNYVRLLTRLGGKIQKDANGKSIAHIPYSSFKIDDWRLLTQFVQTFTRQHPNAIVQFKNGKEIYSAPMNSYAAARDVKISWIDRIKLLAENNDRLVYYDKVAKKYKTRPLQSTVSETKEKEFKVYTPLAGTKTFKTEKEASLYVKQTGISIRSFADSVEFLNNIGITFTKEAVQKLSKTDKNNFMSAVSVLFKHLSDKSDLLTLSGRTLDINGPLDVLSGLFVKATNPNKESTHYGIDGKRRGDFTESNATSVLEDDFNEAGTLENLLQIRPELNDLYSEGSLILKKGGNFIDKNGKIKRSIHVEYIQGTKNTYDGTSTMTNALNIGERYTQEINQNLNGKYYIIIPADSTTEWMMNFGLFFTHNELLTDKKKWNAVLPVFTDYLLDDVRLSLDSENRSNIKNVKNNGAKELRFFKDILTDTKMLDDINQLIKEDAPYETIKEYVYQNQDVLQSTVKNLITGMSSATQKTLIDNNQISITGKNAEEFSFPGLDSLFTTDNKYDKNNLSKKELDNIFDFATINQVISNIEMHKILFGDPYQFKSKDGILDETKRIKSFLSPRKKMFDMPEFNTFLDEEFNQVNDELLGPDDPGFHKYKPYANVVVLKDLFVAGSLSNRLKNYSKTEEADGFSWAMDATYKEVLLKNGQWSNEAEAWHQWQMSYTRQNMPGYVYPSKSLESYDLKMVASPTPKYTLKVLKPIVSGTRYDSPIIKLNLHKFAQMPMYFSMVKGTTMEKHYIKMFKERMDYAVMESGTKVGIIESHNIYNPDGSFNETPYNNLEEVSWKSYGIQVETESAPGKGTTRGSQLTKMSSMNLFANGIAVSEAAQKAYDENTALLDKMHENGYKELLQKLGVEDTGNGFVMKNGEAISEVLLSELLRREASDNLKDVLKLDDEKQFLIPFEAAPSYISIRDIVYSMVTKSLIRPKLSGGAHVQVPSTMFEEATKGRSLIQKQGDKWVKISKDNYQRLSEDDKKTVVLGDDTLKFYKDADGKRAMEIMLPHWFKNTFPSEMSDEEVMDAINDSPDRNEILKGIGFRIPTQALSSIEVFKVKRFLPQYMGATVVVPSEITMKSGSDFDIDKLNMYLKSLYRDNKGVVRLIKLFKTEKATKDFYGAEFDTLLSKRKISKQNVLDRIESGSIENEAAARSEDVGLSLMLDLIFGTDDLSDKTHEEIAKLNDVQLQSNLRERFVNKMYSKALENEYYKTLEDLITIKENFIHLISPVDDAGLKYLSKKLDKLRNVNEGAVKNKLIDKNYLTNLRAQFILAKRWIGIAAVNITNLSIRQKSPVYFDRTRISNLSEYDKKYLGLGNIQLPHNKVTVDGAEYASISDIKTVDGTQYISNRLSGFATATVDVAKDPFLLKVYSSDLLINPAMFLEAIGVGELGAIFINQPIIQEYVKMLDSRNDKRLFNDENVYEIESKFPESSTYNVNTPIDLSLLEDNISEYSGENGVFKPSTQANNDQQRLILLEFLKYSKLGRNMFSLSQASNYDTTTFRNGEELMRKQIQTQVALKNNLFSSVDNILGTTFIGTQERFITEAIKAANSVFKMDSPALKSITNEMLLPYAENAFMSKDDYSKIIQDIKIGLLDYIIQTGHGLDGKRVEDLMVTTETSVAMKLEVAKLKYDNLQILKDLQVVSAREQGGFKTIKLNADIKEAYDENYYTGLMRELRDHDAQTNDLYKDLISVAIIQGTKRSPISIKTIIPIEDYAAIVTPLINTASNSLTKEIFSKGMFHRNHFSQDMLVPVFSPKFRNLRRDFEPIAMNPDGSEVFMYNSPQYPELEGLGIKGSERKVLLMSEKYNRQYTQYDYIKVKRTIDYTEKDWETGDTYTGYIDLATGRNISYRQMMSNREKGDYSLFQQYGYTKVKLENGDPVTTVDKKGNVSYVYKLINLYGEGILGNEYYDSFQKSRANNGTFSVEEEIPDAVLIDYYGALTASIVQGIQTDKVITRLGIQGYVSRSAVQQNKNTLYLFGDNDVRSGMGGMAREMRGEPNSIGISTKKSPTNDKNGFKTDEQLDANKAIITEDINKAVEAWDTGEYNRLVIPAIGEGLADLLNKAPLTYTFLQEELERLQKHVMSTQNVETPILSEDEKIVMLPTEELNNIPIFSERGVNVMRKPGNYHFGNPYTGTFNKPGLMTIFDSFGKYNTTEARNNASEAYKNWLLGERDIDLNQTQRRWILAQIDKGLLDNEKLLYMNDRKGYISHATKLLEVVEIIRGTTQEQENEVSLPEKKEKPAPKQKVKSDRILKSDIEFAIKEAKSGILDDSEKLGAERIDLGLPRADIRAGAKALLNGKTKSINAERVVRALKEARELGYYEYMVGTGGKTTRVQVPILEETPVKGNPDQLDLSNQTEDWVNEDNNDDLDCPF